MNKWLRICAQVCLAAGLGLLLTGGPALAADAPAFVPGEVVVWAQDGVSEAAVRNAGADANCEFVRACLMPGVYLLRVKSAGGAAPTAAQTTDAVNALKPSPLFRWVGTNRIYRYLDTVPNDPRYREQWHLPLMNMPQAWDLEKGKDGIIVGVVDSGVTVSHPDLQGRLLPGYNASGGSTTDVTDNDGHGTHVIGTIVAATNNGIGVAGVAYEGVKVLPLKGGDGGTTITAIVDALQYAQTQGVHAVNMSLGAPTTSDTPPAQLPPDEAKIVQMARAGVVFTIAAGNSFTDGNPPITPAYLAQLEPNIICVAACDKLKRQAPYSSARKYTTITAPGGNQETAPTDGVLSTYLLSSGGYEFLQGTSMAAPNAAGVVALLLSAGAAPSEIKEALTSTADRSMMTTVPSDAYGYGVIDAYAALLKAGVSVTVVEPDGTGGKASQGGIPRNPDPVETMRPLIRIAVNQIEPSNLTVKLNGAIVTSWTVENVTRTVKDLQGNDVPVVYEAVIQGVDMPAGQNVVEVSGVKPGPPDRVVTDTRKFVIQPRQIAAGRSLISIPYYQEDATPETYFGLTFRLARWMPLENRYAIYAPMVGTDPGASFSPPDVRPRPEGDPAPKYPVGLAFWADTESVKPVLTKGQAMPAKPFIIPLRGRGSLGVPINWNMVGCPFPFDVPFNALLVDTPEGRITIGAAVDRGYVLPNIFSYDGANGYTFRTLPDGALRAWEGHWIGVTTQADIALVVPPARATRSATAVASVADRSGWKLRLAASTAGQNDTYNFLGVSSGASDGRDLADVAKPPMVSPYVTVGIQNSDVSGGLLAQDMRSAGGQKVWDVVVSTDVANADVTVRWNAVASWPRNVKLLWTDVATGQTVDMRTRASVTFNAGPNPTPRLFKVSAVPATGNATRITNVAVRTGSTRATGAVQIGFTLSNAATYDVRVLGADGRPVATVGSRAAQAGDINLVWGGRDAAGRSVPAGTYLMQIKAIGSDGDVVRVIQPFSMVR
ncbi:MAG: S8 family serine peptidase [Chthonomonadales bacterium]|nr:S8 family serine peptidase [Chthonomonadales bacterium]